MKLEIGQLLGNYRIVRPLGKGGMGEVYEVEHVRLGVRYALKAFVLAHGQIDLLRERFVAEGKILARLNHPNLVRVFEMDFDAASNSLYFVMDLVVGEAGLAKCLDEVEIGSVDEDTAARWFCQLCSALDYIHSRGIVHRDIKPSNILVAADGSVRLVDFGVSRYVTDELRRTLAIEQRQVDGEWRSGTFNVKMGTGDYMAPEVRRGGEATAASDAYSLGLVFFHLLTGMWYAPRRKMLDMLDPFEKPWKAALGVLLKEIAKERAEELSPLATKFLSDGNKNPIRHSRRPIWQIVSALTCLSVVGFCFHIWFSPPPHPAAETRTTAKADVEPPHSRTAAALSGSSGREVPLLPARESTGSTVFATASTTQEVVSCQTSAIVPISPSTNKTIMPPTAPSDPVPPEKPCNLSFGESYDIDLDDARISMIWCTNGVFFMGSPETEQGHFRNETRHKVEISHGFWIAQTEVTQGQWKSLMGGQTIEDLAASAWHDRKDEDVGTANEDSKDLFRTVWSLPKNYDTRKRCGDLGDNLPVYYVSWEQATNFCEKLTKMGRAANAVPHDYAYRLPTEAEWEYACRAGSNGTLPNGSTFEILAMNNATGLGDYAWYGGNSSMGFNGRGFDTKNWAGKECPGGLAAPREVASRKPNGWNIYDMLGNVWEWCYDGYGPYTTTTHSNSVAIRDPVGPFPGYYHVVRGGSWSTPACMCRPAYRDGLPSGIGNFIGFRIVLAPVIRR